MNIFSYPLLIEGVKVNGVIKEKLKMLPDKPGVYIMKDELNNIIYVGKAKILKNRVRSYFVKSANHNNKVLKMIDCIYDLNWIVTDSEIEALILECNLIKRHRPKYNILLKDDKTFPYIKITTSEDYPRIMMTRKVDNKKDKFFGPYVSSYSVKEVIDLLRKTYGIRSCNLDLKKEYKGRECLNYHINQCSCPCMKYISKEDYNNNIKEIIRFLNGKEDGILKKLKADMEKASSELKFELAGELRDRINHINQISEKQKISAPKNSDIDVLGIYDDEEKTCVTVMFIRNGKMLGSKNMFFKSGEEKEEVLKEFIKQFYDASFYIPKEIIIPFTFSDMELIGEFLSAKKGSNVILNYAKLGKKKQLSLLALNNAKEGLKQKKGNKFESGLYELKELLNLEKIPERIEVYDISNTGGKDIVGFMTVFENGKPNPKEYRKFKIKYHTEQDDYGAMYEVIYRRLIHYLEDRLKLENGEDREKLKFINLPDLIFVDGGMNHVKVGKNAVKMAELSIDVFGLVKDNKHKTRDITDDCKEYECYLKKNAFNLVSKMQDETHNQAVKFHHHLRTNNLIRSDLLNIDGIGDKTRQKLFSYFETIDNIKNASKEELNKVVNKTLAEKIYNYYHKNE
ncbi:MAG: excinuclease ABC subunit UvrC [Ruminococcaceae bacterium]|nr:excinuclease ABC subunit UvrC [Oscillospiraceae bacterium]